MGQSKGSRVRRTVIRVVALVAVLGFAAFVFTRCSSMAIASWRAIPELQAVVGDRGVVSPYLREASINVTPSCLLYVDVAEGVSTEELASILAGIAPTERFEPCKVNRLRLASNSDVHAEDWNAISAEGWLAVADLMNRPGPVSIFLNHDNNHDNPARVRTYSEPELFPDLTAMVRGLISGDARLEEAVGATEWQIDWRASIGAYNEVRVITAETPPLALADFLDAMVPVMESSVSIKITYVINDTALRTRVELSEANETVAATITAAFTSSGLGGELALVFPEAARSDKP